MDINDVAGGQVVPAKESVPSVPGIGVGGAVFCPFKFTPTLCMKQGCELWVELQLGKNAVGRCAFSWAPVILTEVRREIEFLRTSGGLSPKHDKEKKK